MHEVNVFTQFHCDVTFLAWWNCLKDYVEIQKNIPIMDAMRMGGILMMVKL